MDKVLARFFIEEISSAVSQEEYPSVLLGPLAKLRSFTLDENVTVFFFLAVHRLLQGRSVHGKLLVDCMINSDNGGLSTASVALCIIIIMMFWALLLSLKNPPPLLLCSRQQTPLGYLLSSV